MRIAKMATPAFFSSPHPASDLKARQADRGPGDQPDRVPRTLALTTQSDDHVT
jgi:hypothetical protein